MAASSAARLSDIGFSLMIGSPGVFRRTRQYIPARESGFIAPTVNMCSDVLESGLSLEQVRRSSAACDHTDGRSAPNCCQFHTNVGQAVFVGSIPKSGGLSV